jgi:hypothetical protein
MPDCGRNAAEAARGETICRAAPLPSGSSRIPVAMESLTVLKFSSEDCGTCHRMSNYDARVAEELGLQFVSVLLQDTDTYRRYRKVLLAQYPNKEGMGWPTYLVVSNPESQFVIHGEIKGGMPKGDFRERIRATLPQA